MTDRDMHYANFADACIDFGLEIDELSKNYPEVVDVVDEFSEELAKFILKIEHIYATR